MFKENSVVGLIIDIINSGTFVFLIISSIFIWIEIRKIQKILTIIIKDKYYRG